MLIARCISALTDGPANQRGRSPHSDSLAVRVAPPSLTPPIHHHQQQLPHPPTHPPILTSAIYIFKPQPNPQRVPLIYSKGSITEKYHMSTTSFICTVFSSVFSPDILFPYEVVVANVLFAYLHMCKTQSNQRVLIPARHMPTLCNAPFASFGIANRRAKPSL